MAYKTIDETFWTDPKVRGLSVNNKLLFLYLITNPHSHYSGLYYLPMSVMALETGLKQIEVRRGIDTLSKGYIVKYDDDFQVVWVVKMALYQAKGEKMMAGIANHFGRLHNCPLIKDFLKFYNTLSIPYACTIDTPSIPHAESVTGSVTETVSGSKDILSGKPDSVSATGEVVSYLNQVLGTDYKATTRKTRELIQARLREGFTVEDFRAVINRKAQKWRGDPKMVEYLRPITLFGPKFESYLNEKEAQNESHKLDNQTSRTPAGGVRSDTSRFRNAGEPPDGGQRGRKKGAVAQGERNDEDTATVPGKKPPAVNEDAKGVAGLEVGTEPLSDGYPRIG